MDQNEEMDQNHPLVQQKLNTMVMDRLNDIFKTMNIPPGRKTDWFWLGRNLPINNQGHPDLEEAMNLVRWKMVQELKD